VTTSPAIEQRLLELAYTTDVKITATALAYFAPCSIEDATRVLEELAARDRVNMEIESDGTVVYHVRARERFAPRALVPAVERAAPATPFHPLAAALLSVFVPGAGHAYVGRIAAGVMWFLVVSLGYVLILPGLVVHLFSIASAAAAARRVSSRPPRLLAAG
jgi:hypothetical protein